MPLEVSEVCAWFQRGQDPSQSVCFPSEEYQESTLISHVLSFSSPLQEWTYTYNHHVRQQQLCLSVYTLFPGSQVLLSPCKEGDNKQVSPFIDPRFLQSSRSFSIVLVHIKSPVGSDFIWEAQSVWECGLWPV